MSDGSTGATPWVAWIGACTGVASLAWNIYVKLTSGARLVVTAFPNMIMMPREPGNPKYVSVTVQNVGTAATTLTNLTLQIYESKWKRRRRKASSNYVVVNYQGPALPHKLEVGSEWRALVAQDDRFAELLNSDKLWCGVWHSFSKKPVEFKVPQIKPEPEKTERKQATANE
jgi:hypothetical protein